ncbi:MAG TPA: sensory rhodopsin transducer [Chitinophagaceae bacterium]|nr:sensory rhodopsin transducer [Chitinophagaceae bacterium]
MDIGKKVWAIAEGFIPGWSNGPAPDFISHDAACILNTSDDEAHVEITIYFSDRQPAGPFITTVPAKRTKHLRFNDFSDPEAIPRETDYASVFISDVPIVVQYTRLDSRQAENALISTIAYTQ